MSENAIGKALYRALTKSQMTGQIEEGEERKERCRYCGDMVSDWVDPDWAKGRVCLKCESVHEPKPAPAAEMDTPRTDAAFTAWNLRRPGATDPADFARTLERELNAAKASAPTGIEAMVCADIAARQALGIRKYGQTVAENPATLPEWLTHAYQEMLDGAIYLKRASAEIDNQAAEIERLRRALEGLANCIDETRGKDAYEALNAAREALRGSGA